jgi:hypothetical protein
MFINNICVKITEQNDMEIKSTFMETDLSKYSLNNQVELNKMVYEARNYATTKLAIPNSRLEAIIKQNVIGFSLISPLVDYRRYFEPYINEEDLEEPFKQRPTLYSKVKYGTSEFADIILSLNNIYDPVDFNISRVKYLSQSGMMLLIALLKIQ